MKLVLPLLCAAACALLCVGARAQQFQPKQIGITGPALLGNSASGLGPGDNILLNTTLQFDGSGKLGVDLGTANTWTVRQTFGAGIQINGASGAAVSDFSVQTNTKSAYSVAGVQIATSADYGSFGDTNTTFGAVIIGGKSGSAANYTGSWQEFSAVYNGYGGGDSSAFLTAGQELMQPTASSFNISGHYFGNNPECLLGSGFTAVECTAEEDDVEVLSTSTVVIKNGHRVVDIGSTVDASTGSTGYSVLKKDAVTHGFGFGYFLGDIADVGDSDAFPLDAGGTVLGSVASTVALKAGIDFSGLTGTFTEAGIVLPKTGTGGAIWFGSDASGGQIQNTTSANGPQLRFGNNAIAIDNVNATQGIAILGLTQTEIQATTAATTTTDGALRSDGGLSVAGAGFFGGAVSAIGNFAIGATAGITKTCSVIPTAMTISGGIITSITGGTCT